MNAARPKPPCLILDLSLIAFVIALWIAFAAAGDASEKPHNERAFVVDAGAPCM